MYVYLFLCVCLYVNLMCAQAKFAEFVFYFLFDFILLRVVAAEKGNPWTRHKHRFTRSAQLENQHMFSAEFRIFHMLMMMMMGPFFWRILFDGLIQSIHKGQRSLYKWYTHAYMMLYYILYPITVRIKVDIWNANFSRCGTSVAVTYVVA